MEQNNHESVSCPCCENKRIIDKHRGREILVKEESEFSSDMIPDLFVKCQMCKRQIGIKFL